VEPQKDIDESGLRVGLELRVAYYPGANPLVPLNAVAEKSNTPVSKAVIIRLEPV
jgi:hypothetical protein